MMQVEAEQSLAERAYSIVEEEIVTLRLAPGTVFSEAGLAESVGIGRTPIREALQRLAAGHLIRVLPRRGMIVADIDLVGFLSLLATRRVLDRLIVGSAARRASDNQRGALRLAAESMLEASATGMIDAFMQADRRADQVLEAASGNPYAVSAAVPLHAHCRRFWMRYHESGDISRSAHLHGLMLEAVVEGDEAAATRASDALVDYLERLTRSILDRHG